MNDRYANVELLGQGGMGEVTLCSDRTIGREVAMKIAHAALNDAEASERFGREARIQGQLEHPSVVPVYDFFQGDDGRWRFTMKRVRGRDLEDIVEALRRGDPDAVASYSTRKLLSAFSTVCQALAFAHARGVVHRDLKPANIMLGEFGEVHVLDWGLAKVIGAPDAITASPDPATGAITVPGGNALTIAGNMMGTPGYMPPEQAQGETDLIDARSDVYALGSILFEILTLRPLHEGTHVTHVIGSTLKGADARAHVRAPDRHVAPELEQVCVRATATAPADRYATVMEMHHAIEQFLEGDRDLERRRTMANGHVARAREARADYDTRRDISLRSVALREAGAALAIDPNHDEARDITLSLLVDVPREVPPEARAELEASPPMVARSARSSQLVQYLGWLAFGPMIVGLGVLDWTWFIVMSALLGAAIFGAVIHVRGKTGGTFAFVVFLFGTFITAAMTAGFGPLILAPHLAVTNVLSYIPFAEPRFRLPAILTSLASIVLPFLAFHFGLFADPYSFEGGALVIRSHVLRMVPGSTEGLLLLAAIALVGATPLVLAYIRQQVDDAEKRLFLHAWSLRQVLPAPRGASEP